VSIVASGGEAPRGFRASARGCGVVAVDHARSKHGGRSAERLKSSPAAAGAQCLEGSLGAAPAKLGHVEQLECHQQIFGSRARARVIRSHSRPVVNG